MDDQTPTAGDEPMPMDTTEPTAGDEPTVIDDPASAAGDQPVPMDSVEPDDSEVAADLAAPLPSPTPPAEPRRSRRPLVAAVAAGLLGIGVGAGAMALIDHDGDRHGDHRDTERAADGRGDSGPFTEREHQGEQGQRHPHGQGQAPSDGGPTQGG